VQGCTFFLTSILFSFGGLPSHPQNPHSWRTKSWTPLETMATFLCRNRSVDLIHGGRWWRWIHTAGYYIRIY